MFAADVILPEKSPPENTWKRAPRLELARQRLPDAPRLRAAFWRANLDEERFSAPKIHDLSPSTLIRAANTSLGRR